MGNLHKHLLTIVPKRLMDYEPYGVQERDSGDCSWGCKWAAWLEDEPADWLVCTNPNSHRCGLLTFEHQGCSAFEGESDVED